MATLAMQPRARLQLFAVLVAARQLRTALFAREIRKITHTEAFSPAYTLGYRG